MQQWVDVSPELAAQQLREFVEQQEAAANPPDRPLSDVEQQIADYQAANQAYAETIRQKTQSSLALTAIRAGARQSGRRSAPPPCEGCRRTRTAGGHHDAPARS